MAGRPRNPAVPKKRSNDRGWRIYAAGFIAILVLVFVIQNSQKVEFNFLFANTSTPLFFVIAISVALGALIGWLFPHVRRDRRRERSERDRYDKPKD